MVNIESDQLTWRSLLTDSKPTDLDGAFETEPLELYREDGGSADGATLRVATADVVDH